jgi:hypothetical protein
VPGTFFTGRMPPTQVAVECMISMISILASN